MKETSFYILINLKTVNGFESIGKFSIGNNRQFSYLLFKDLQGSSDVDEKAMLTMELMETVNELPVNLKIISCTLDELPEICRHITREMFKAINLEELI